MSTAVIDELQAEWSKIPYLADPYPTYELLREHAPLIKTPAGFWQAMTYELNDAIFRAPKIFSSDARHAHSTNPYLDDPQDGLFSQIYREIIMHKDGDAHRRMRQLAQPIFTPRAMEAFRAQIAQAITAQLDEALANCKDNQFDFINDFALPLPTNVILDMFGFPNSEAYRFYETSDLIVPPLERPEPAEWLAEADRIYGTHWDFIVDAARQRRADPGDDLLSHIAATSEEGDSLSDLQLVSFVTFLVTAGYETTANTLATGLYTLFKFPEQRERLKRDRGLLASAAEEILRYEPASRNGGMRHLTQDLEFGGQQLRRGDSIITCVSSANHDQAKFDDPEGFDVGRRPNLHITFAAGPHSCLGMALARVELQEALRIVLERLPDIHLAGEAQWKPSFIIRGLESLPVGF